MEFGKKADKIISENFKYIKTTSRLFYPKNIKLSTEFIQAFKKEHNALVKTGVDPKKSLEKICKALRFHL